MKKLLKTMLLSTVVFFAISSAYGCVSSEASQNTFEVPYDNPVIGWDRHSCDSANSFNGWFRWWEYLCMKHPRLITWTNGLKFRIYPGNEMYRAIFVRGMYDPNSAVVVGALLGKGGVFVDVGANMGYFSLLMSKIVGENGRILAIEPSNRDFSRLIDNVQVNNLNNLISTYKIAISNKQSTVKLHIACEERSALNTIGKEFSCKGIEKKRIENVDAITLDKFISDKHLDGIDVLKIDVEGSEAFALEGASKTIAKFRPALMLGLNRDSLALCGSTVQKLEQQLKSMKYVVYEIVETPIFELKKVERDLLSVHSKVVFCLHENVVPPTLPQPIKRTFIEKCKYFFTRQ